MFIGILTELEDWAQHLHWPERAAPYLAGIGLVALVLVYRIRRRGQTVAEAFAALRAERAARRANRRLRAEARRRVREVTAALPWLHNRRLRPDMVPGVTIAPAPRLPGYHQAGYDIVLDAPGDMQTGAVRAVMRLTRLDPKRAKELIERAPVTVLRVPDLAMAQAARAILESWGATVSVTDPAD
jgi:ribosomal protein L7/L12